MTDRISPILASLPLFEGLSGEGLELLAKGVEIRDFAPGAVIAAERDAVGGFFVVLSGQVKLSMCSLDGKEQTVYVFRPGEPFGLCAMFAGGGIPMSATAMAPTRVLFLEGRRLAGLAQAEPALLLNILGTLSRRLKDAFDLIESLSLRDIPARLAAFFLHEARSLDDRSGVLRLNMSHRELAKIIGATPESLSRALGRMTRAGMIRVEGRDIVLEKPEELAACADSGCPKETG